MSRTHGLALFRTLVYSSQNRNLAAGAGHVVLSKQRTGFDRRRDSTKRQCAMKLALAIYFFKIPNRQDTKKNYITVFTG